MRLRETRAGRRGRRDGGEGGVARWYTEVDVKGEEVKGEKGEEEKEEEEAAAEEARVLLGGRTEGGWVLSRFALHAPELCARSGRGREDPTVLRECSILRESEELITSAILPSLDAAEDHDFST